MSTGKRSLISEDWLSLWLGLFVFVLSLGIFVNIDTLGWGIKTNVWTDIFKSTSTVSKTYESIPGIISIILTSPLVMLFKNLRACVSPTSYNNLL